MTKLTPYIFKNIEDRLINMCDINNKKVIKNISYFDNNSIPNASIGYYIKRIKKYFDCSDHFIVLALIYIDRYIQYNNLLIRNQSIHRLLITACVISAKFLEDEHHSNKFFSEIGAFSLTELNLLEREMLNGLDYNLYVSKIEYYECLHELQNYNLSQVVENELQNNIIPLVENELRNNNLSQVVENELQNNNIIPLVGDELQK